MIRLPRKPTQEDAKHIVHEVNQFFNRPVAIIIALLILFVYFAIGNAQFQKDNRLLLERTKLSADNTAVIVSKLKEVLCEDIPDKDCNLSKAVNTILADHHRQEVYFDCILTSLGNPNIARSEIDTLCAKAAMQAKPADSPVTNNFQPQPKTTTTQKKTSKPSNTDKTPKHNPKNIFGNPACLPDSLKFINNELCVTD